MMLVILGSALRSVCRDQAALGLTFVREVETVPVYRLFAVGRDYAALVEVAHGGVSVTGELCATDDNNIAELMKDEPDGLKLSPVKLSDGSVAFGAVSTLETLPQGARDISEYRGFAAFLEAVRAEESSR